MQRLHWWQDLCIMHFVGTALRGGFYTKLSQCIIEEAYTTSHEDDRKASLNISTVS